MAKVETIRHEDSGTEARILVSTGFNLFSWIVADGAEQRDLIHADADFASGESRPTSGGNPIMFPFAGRIQGGTYKWNNKDWQLPEGDGRGNAIHGFAFNRPWRVVDQSEHSIAGEFSASCDAADAVALWPCDYTILATYTVGAGSLRAEVSLKNSGDSPLPCSFGWHPYFRLPLSESGSTAQTVIKIPTHKTLPLEDMIPTGEVTDIDDALSNGLQLDDREFDEPFLLDTPKEPAYVCELTDRASGRVLRQTFDSTLPYAVVYTPGHREAICIEPQTSPPDIFRMKEAGLPHAMIVLEPGEVQSYGMTLDWIT